MTEERVAKILQDSLAALGRTAANRAGVIAEIADRVTAAVRAGRFVYVCGCGGSAADAQHFAAELMGRFKKDSKAMPCLALTTDTSLLTAVGNDYGFDRVFDRQVEGVVREGDVLVAISTSGNSPSIVNAARRARERGAVVVGMTGRDGGALKAETDCCLCVDADGSALVQESHGVAIHAICEIVEIDGAAEA